LRTHEAGARIDDEGPALPAAFIWASDWTEIGATVDDATGAGEVVVAVGGDGGGLSGSWAVEVIIVALADGRWDADAPARDALPTPQLARAITSVATARIWPIAAYTCREAMNINMTRHYADADCSVTTIKPGFPRREGLSPVNHRLADTFSELLLDVR